MKKLIIMSLASMIISSSFAQFVKGDNKIGGIFNLSMSGTKTTDNDTTIKGPKTVGFEFQPQYGYFITDKTCIGAFIDINLSHTTTRETHNGGVVKLKDKTSKFGIGPEISHFRFIGEKQKFAIYATAGLGFTTSGGKVEHWDFINNEVVSADKDRTTGLSLWAAPGMIYAPEHWFFFDVRFDGFGIWYNYSSTKVEASTNGTKNKSSSLQIGGNLNELFLTNTKVGVSFEF